MRHHVVLLRFEPELPADDELRARAARMAAEIDVVSGMRLGRTSMSPDLARGYHYLLSVELVGDDALAAYLSHPAHDAFGQWLRGQGAEHLVFSYDLDKITVLR